MKNFYNRLLSKISTKFNKNIFKMTGRKPRYTNPTSLRSEPIYYRQFFIFPLLFLPKLAYSEEEEKQSVDLEMKEIVKGEYENKIRTFASIEKRFLVFAKVKKYGDYRMNYTQFLDSLVPFNYIKTKSSEEMESFLQSNENFQKIIKFIDVNNDNYINFEEYVCLSILLSVPISTFLQNFPGGKITRGEFADLLMEEIKKQNSLKVTEKSIIDGRIIKTDELQLRQCFMDFFTKAFKNETKISIEKDLEALKYKIYYLLTIYEFYKIPQSGPSKISMENFAKVLASYVNIYKAKNILTRIQEKQIPLEGEVTYDEFFCFFVFMNCLLDDKYGIFQNKKLSFEDFKKLINDKKGSLPDFGIKLKKNISDAQLKVLINIFDDNGKFLYC
jgi:hypothetical protein